MVIKKNENFNKIYSLKFGPTPNYPLIQFLEPEIKDNIIIAGPCAVESISQINQIFPAIVNDVSYFRGGVFRAGTYPSDKWGLQLEMLQEYHKIAKKLNRPNIVDVLDIRDLEKIEPYTDIYQVGTRQAQHYALLKELGKQPKPVILKRGMYMTLDEFLGAGEYILKEGNRKLILCERGGVSYLNHTRWELSLSLIAKIKQITRFPIIIDASHGTGDKTLVESMTYAGIMAGADGCLIECHNDPNNSLSDKDQAISIEHFIKISRNVKKLFEIRKSMV